MNLLEIVTMIYIKTHYQVWSIGFLIKKKWIASGISLNEKLAEKFHKPIIQKFKRRKSTRDLKTKFGQQIYLKLDHRLQLDHVFIKYAWFTPSSVKKSKAVLNAFIEIVNESNLKSSKLWVDKGREFYNQLMQEYLDNNVTLMYSA